MRRLSLLLAGVALAIGAGVVAQVVPGGLPSQPTFQKVTVAGPSVPDYVWFNTGAGTDAKRWDQYVDTSGVMHFRLINDANGAAQDWMTVSRTTVASAAVNFPSVVTLSTGTASLTAADTTVTLTFATASMPNCTATGTNSTLTLHKIGKVVTVLIGGNSTCSTTAGTTNLASTNTPIPAGFRPATGTTCGNPNITNSVNPGGMAGFFCVSTVGNVQFFSVPGVGATSMGLVGQGTFTYTLD